MLLKIAEPNLTWLEAVFTSVAVRTTGFSTINMAETLPITKLIISFLMIIGGAPRFNIWWNKNYINCNFSFNCKGNS